MNRLIIGAICVLGCGQTEPQDEASVCSACPADECALEEIMAVDEKVDVPGEVPFRSLDVLFGDCLHVDSAETTIWSFGSAAEWDAFWNGHFLVNQFCLPRAPPVLDFTEGSLVALFLGECEYSGVPLSYPLIQEVVVSEGHVVLHTDRPVLGDGERQASCSQLRHFIQLEHCLVSR